MRQGGGATVAGTCSQMLAFRRFSGFSPLPKPHTCAILHYVKLIAHIKLLPTPDQHAVLQRTLEQANAACNYISGVAWETRTFNKFDLQRLVYQTVRAQFDLSAQLTVRMLAKVGDAYKLDKQTQRTFKPHGAIAYDDRILSYQLSQGTVNIWTLDGRQRIPFVCGERQRELLQFRQGESDLVLVNGVFYLLAVCEIEEPTPADIAGVLGVDLGIANIASDSDGAQYSGEQVDHTRQRYHGLRQRLQRCGTKSAKRHLKKLRKRQARFQRDTNHRISKALVAKAKDTGRGIALEDLSDIRERARSAGVGTNHAAGSPPAGSVVSADTATAWARSISCRCSSTVRRGTSARQAAQRIVAR